jgi:aflatoxin B1 aldehyde reductase
VAKKYGITGHAASLRWVVHHSALSGEYGDAVIIGASKVEQLRENLEIYEAGPLPDEIVQTIEGVWPSVKEIAPWAWSASATANSLSDEVVSQPTSRVDQ